MPVCLLLERLKKYWINLITLSWCWNIVKVQLTNATWLKFTVAIPLAIALTYFMMKYTLIRWITCFVYSLIFFFVHFNNCILHLLYLYWPFLVLLACNSNCLLCSSRFLLELGHTILAAQCFMLVQRYVF